MATIDYWAEASMDRGQIALFAPTLDSTIPEDDPVRLFDEVLTIPARSPQVSFAAKGRYLPRKAWRSLPVRHMNLEKIELRVRHIPRRKDSIGIGA